MKDVITRNIERLLQLDAEAGQEHIEPMTEWKWQRLYKVATEYGIGPWIAEGIRAYENDFFLQMSPALHQQFLEMAGTKDPEKLKKYLLTVDRSQRPINRFKRESLEAYARDFIKTIQNIEE